MDYVSEKIIRKGRGLVTRTVVYSYPEVNYTDLPAGPSHKELHLVVIDGHE